MNNPPIVTVSQVNKRILLLLSGDKPLQNVCVKGELSNFTNHYQSGHLYFTLKDENSQIKGIMFESNTASLKFMPENGMNVIVSGSVEAFLRDGTYQLYATNIDVEGAGTLSVQYEKLKKKLQSAGYFSQKRQLPQKVRNIGIVTSATGAALQDVIHILSVRYPFVTLHIFNALVQGVDAPYSVAAAIKRAQYVDIDVLIVGRGGGSAEDLSAFNTEIVAVAIFNSKIPTISAVGHETDFTIADFVADFRAETPSAAAVLAVPDIEEVKNYLDALKAHQKTFILNLIRNKSSELINMQRFIQSRSPRQLIANLEQDIARKERQIGLDFRAIIQKKELALGSVEEILRLKNPSNTLQRGYTLAYKNNNVVSSIKNVVAGETLKLRFADGQATVIVKECSYE